MPKIGQMPSMATIKRWLLMPPVFADDEDQTRLARTLHYGLIALMSALIVNLISGILFGKHRLLGVGIVAISMVAVLVTMIWLRRGQVRRAARFLAVYAWLAVSLLVYLGDGLSTVAPTLYAPAVALTLLFLGWRASLLSAISALVFTLATVIASELGHEPPIFFPLNGFTSWTVFAMGLVCMLVPYAAVYREVTDALQSTQQQLALREKAEAALRESEERFRRITSITSDYTFTSIILDNGLPKNMGVSGAFQAITGYTFEEYEAVGGYRASIHPDDVAEDDRILDILRTNQPVVSELRIYTKSGDLRWTRANAMPIWDSTHNKLVGIIGAVRDITAQKLAEQAIQENEEKFRAIFDLAPYGITIQRKGGKFLDANQAFLDMVGMAREEVIGHNAIDLRIFPDLGQLRGLMQEISITGRVLNRDITLAPRNAAPRSLLISSQQIELADATMVMTIAIDITERKQAEEALRESEERFRLISSATTDYTYASILDDDGRVINIQITGAFEAISGYTSDEFMAIGGWRATLHPDDLPQDDRDLAKLKANQSVVSELRIIRQDGQVRWVRVSAVPVWDQATNQLVGINGGVRDITERKQADQAMFDLNNVLREQTGYLTALLDVARAVTSVTNLETVLQNVFKGLGAVVQFDAFFIALYESASGVVEFPIMFDSGQFYSQPPGQLSKTSRLNEVITTGEPLFINRTAEEITSSHALNSRLGDTSRVSASLMLVPLPYRGKIIGALSTQSYTLNAYSPKHVELLGGAAYIVATAIENARLYEGLQQELADRKALNDIAYAVASLSDLKTTLLTVFEQLRTVVPFDAFYVALYHPDTDELSFPILFDDGKFYDAPPRRRPTTTFGNAEVLITGETVYRNFAPDDVATIGENSHLLGDTSRVTASAIVAPLHHRGKVIGSVSTQSYALNAYTQKHADSLRGAAYIVATAIENARLYEGLQYELADRQTLNDIAYAVASLSDLKTTLLTVFDQLKAVIPFDAFYVALYDAANNELSYPIMFDNGKFFEQSPRKPNTTFGSVDVLATGNMIFKNLTAEDIAPFSHIADKMGDPGQITKSVIVAPLPYRGKIIGTISTQSYTLNAYSQKHADSLRGAAYIVATAIENARLYEGLQLELSHRQALNEVAFAVTGLSDLHSTLRTVFQQLATVVPTDAFYVALYDDSTNILTYPIMLDSGVFYEIQDHVLDPTDRFMQVITENKPLFVNRTAAEIEQATNSRFLIGDTSRISASLMAVPLPYHGKIIGLISVQSYTLNAYTQSHVDILVGASYIVATAIENARLYDGLQQELAHRRAAEEAMRRSEAHLRALLDATTDIAFLMSRDGRFLTVNRTMASSAGQTTDAMIGYNGFDLLGGNLRLERMQRFLRVSQTGQPERWEDRADAFWWDNNLYPVISATGEVEAFALYSRDVTEQKRLEAELQQYTARLEQMVEERTLALRGAKEQIELILHNSTDALALAKPNGDIQTCNPAFEAMFGDRVAGGIEGMIENIVGQEQQNIISHALIEAIGLHQTQHIEAHIITRDGTEKDIDLALIPVTLTDPEGGLGLLVSAHDITHLKELERFKARFVENALHDLGNPIAGLISRIYLVKQSPEQIDQHVGKMQNQAEHLKSLLDDLRFVAELDRGQYGLDLEPVDLNQLAVRVFDTYEPIAIIQNQTLELVEAPNLPIVPLDSRLMERVLVNLVSNAIYYAGDGKRITLQTRFDADNVYVVVEDNGAGISPEDLPHIFERFYRAGKARQQRAGGTGLGLSICKEVVDLHGGTITAHSELGLGSTFTLSLSYQTPAE